MKQYVMAIKGSRQTVLEPSFGDARFVDAFYLQESVESIVAVELDERKVKKVIDNRGYPSSVSVVCSDYLSFAAECPDSFDLIIGNPPYISIKNLNKSTLEKAKTLCFELGIDCSVAQNLWVAFLLASIKLLEEDGVIFFVLPSEFLQVQYAEKLRLFLERQFNTIHILTFSERMFPDIEQETCLVYLTNEKQGLPYIAYKHYDALNYGVPSYESCIERNKPLKKWSNAILSDSQIELLKNPQCSMLRIRDIATSSPGIVTAANKYFILTSEEVEEYQCENYVIPVISKSSMLRGRIALDRDLIKELSDAGFKVYMLDLKNTRPEELPDGLVNYLEMVGSIERRGKAIKDGYKCSKRKPWYGVPIIESGPVCFFKRYDRCPRMCLNENLIKTTDIAYGIKLYEGYDPKSLVFCFYNSVTLAQCEYLGRYYAGGVSELTPSEFKELHVPYMAIEDNEFETLEEMFKESQPLDKIIEFVDTIVFDSQYADHLPEFKKVRNILMSRRNRRD